MNMQFEKVSWIEGANVYEVNVRQYTAEGTFSAFTKHLPRLKDMGVKILWLMPVTPISKKFRLGALGSYYACSSYTEVNPEFGTLDDLKELVQEAHQLEMKLIIDWVANHTGWDHHWTEENPDWYKKDENGNFKDFHGWTDVIDLNYESKEMRAAMIAAMEFWIKECDIDGFRCDMAHLVPLDFWKIARQHCDSLKPLFWLAETEVPEYHEVFDVSYAWEWMQVSEKIPKQLASIHHLKDVLKKYKEDYPPGALKLFFTSNHDENSWNGTEYEKYGDGAKAFAVFCCTWYGTPLIYSGQELPNFKRLKFFDKDQIEWHTNIVLHDFYKSLLELRSNNKALHKEGEIFELATGHGDKIFAYMLVKDHYKILVLLNLSAEDKMQCNVTHEQLNGVYKNLSSGLEYTLHNTETFELQHWEHIVYFSDDTVIKK
jgi:glycosidase